MSDRHLARWAVTFLGGISMILAHPFTTKESASLRAGDGLVVHEWGTFTSLQNEDGRELGGINIDDEPVPEFVHNLSPFLLSPTFLTDLHWRYRMKQVPRHHPQVTLRLETPVIYFYPPKTAELPLDVDVHVRFRGGWLSEFYPKAMADAPGLGTNDFLFGTLTPETEGSLSWSDLAVGTNGTPVPTDWHVWTTPRKVASATLTAASGESERYLFYRGVGNIPAPLRVVTDPSRKIIDIYVRGLDGAGRMPEKLANLWLVDRNEEGEIAYRALGSTVVPDEASTIATTIPYSFSPGEYRKDNTARLSESMHEALRKAGLFADEATAMLETWRRAYFLSPGRRLFYIVPRRWVEQVLPLEIGVPAEVKRVMMGRIELVTEEQRQVLQRIATGPLPDASWVQHIPNSPAREAFFAGRTDFGELGVEIPEHYRLYLELGRFRNALLAEEASQRPSRALTAFIDAYGLAPYRTHGESKKDSHTQSTSTTAERTAERSETTVTTEAVTEAAPFTGE